MILVSLLLIGFAINHFLSLPVSFAGSRLLGAVLIVTALLIDGYAMRTLYRARTTILPHRKSSYLVTEGPFKLSRNPIYLANLILMCGIGLFFQNGWLLPLAVVNGVLTHFLAIQREERHLLALFGYKYECYVKTVRRWI